METTTSGVFSVFLLLSFGGFTLAQQSQTRSLQNVTVDVGEDAVITCGSSNSTNSQQPSWFKYDSGKKGIYDASTQQNFNSQKYSVGNGNGNTLTVMNVEQKDALSYCCNLGGLVDYCSNLVVIISLTASVNPSDDIQVGDTVNLTCSLIYNSATKDDANPSNTFPLSNDQDPQLSMFIGDNEIANAGGRQEVVGTTTVPHSKTLSVNRTVEDSDVGQQLVCQISSKSPQYDKSESADLTIFAETRLAEIIYPNRTRNPQDEYPFNSTFTCLGDGYPYPDVAWLDAATNTTFPGGTKHKRNATWNAPKPGTYRLICSAKNTRSQNTTYNSTTVIAGDSGVPSASQSSKDKVGLGVGLGIGLGVPVLVGLIVLIVILSRRKKSSEPYPVKQPETKSKSQSTGKSPNGKNGKNSDPAPGPRNNVNPNPNPSYTTPVMPEQTGSSAPRNVRDSPGYGDLGVKQIGGGGSNPHLNESFDSKANASFDSSRNYPPDGNFVIKPGRTSHSPSAPNTSV